MIKGRWHYKIIPVNTNGEELTSRIETKTVSSAQLIELRFLPLSAIDKKKQLLSYPWREVSIKKMVNLYFYNTTATHGLNRHKPTI
jgi:hypothetical protein